MMKGDGDCDDGMEPICLPVALLTASQFTCAIGGFTHQTQWKPAVSITFDILNISPVSTLHSFNNIQYFEYHQFPQFQRMSGCIVKREADCGDSEGEDRRGKELCPYYGYSRVKWNIARGFRYEIKEENDECWILQ